MLLLPTLLFAPFLAPPQDPPPPVPEADNEEDLPPPSPEESSSDDEDSSSGGGDGSKDPDTEQPVQHVPPEEALKALKDAVKEKDAVLLASTIQTVGRTPDKAVAKQIAGFMRHKDPFVRMEAVKALRFNEDPSVVGLLLKQSKNKVILEDPEVGKEYIYALGQHADKKALPILTDDLRTSGPDREITAAKIVSLGRIRETASVEALMDVMVSGGRGTGRRGRRGGGGMPFSGELQTSLTVLTGEDIGGSSSDWQAWWNDSKKKFKIDKEEPPLPRKMKVAWTMQWLSPEDKDAAKKKLKKAIKALDDLGGIGEN